MKVLIVYAANNLDVAREIEEITDNFDFEIMYNIQPREAVKRIAKGKADIVHFATHGGNHALSTSENEWLSSYMLNEAMKYPSLLFANACDSINLIEDVEVPSIITWDYTVTDKDASEFAVAFYRALSLTNDIEKSVDIAKKTFKLTSKNEAPIYLNRTEKDMKAGKNGSGNIAISVTGNIKTLIGQQIN